MPDSNRKYQNELHPPCSVKKHHALLRQVLLSLALSVLVILGGCKATPLPGAGRPDGGVRDGGSLIDGGNADDGGIHEDGGATPDGGIPEDGGATPDGGASCPNCWRSTLYPENWTPLFEDLEGRFLHDFSYAGYHNGEKAIPDSPPGSLFSVTDYGADNTGAQDSTAGIQAAIEAASQAGGGIVLLPAGDYKCDGLLTIRKSNVVIRGANRDSTRIYFTSTTGMSNQASITFSGAITRGSDLLLAQDGVNRSKEVRVTDASSLQVGQAVAVGWVITDAFVEAHGMTGTWAVSNGQWRPFFLRKVMALDLTATPHKVTLDVPLRYPAKVSNGASLRTESGYLEECGIESLSISNAVDWDAAWNENRGHAIKLRAVKDCWARNIRSYKSPVAGGRMEYHLQSGGIKVEASKRVTVAQVTMERAQNRGGGGNGYLFEICKGNEVLIRDSVGRRGRHNFIQNWDFGTSGCVFLRTESHEGRALTAKWDPIGQRGYNEYHHSLAMANLVDDSVASDGWFGGNRNDWSSGAGHSVTQSAYWRLRGGGNLLSWQYGWGYIIGTTNMSVNTQVALPDLTGRNKGTEPEDFTEGMEQGELLRPISLYDDQLARRLNR